MSLVKSEIPESETARTLLGAQARTVLGDYVALTKPRIMVLLLFTAYCAMIVAARGIPGLRVTALTLIGLALSTGGAAALNMWYDRDIDAIMKRTRNRPIPAGRVRPAEALWYGIGLEVASFLLLGLTVNWLTALLTLGGFIYYVVVYTMWLKRRTPQNIVIGGGAGSFPPLVGWAAVAGHLNWAAVVMFLIIFLWTPPHFWSLALYKNDDYRRANIPMMPAVRGARTTKWQSLAYTVLLLGASVSLYFTHTVGLIYLAAAILLGGAFFVYTLRTLLEAEPSVIWARRTFKYSLLYLAVLFAVMVCNVQR